MNLETSIRVLIYILTERLTFSLTPKSVNNDSSGADRNVIIGNLGVEYARFYKAA
jgi:hypothetical protein